VYLLFPLGMAVGALLSGIYAHHHRLPCKLIHRAVHPLAHTPQGSAASTTVKEATSATAATPSTYPIQTPSNEVDSADAPAKEERVDDVASRVAPDPAADVDESGFGRDHPLHQVLANQPAKKLLRRLQAPGPLLVTFGSTAMSDFILNWIAHVKRLPPPNNAYVVAALDKPLLQLCEQNDLPGVALAAQDGLLQDKGYFRADEKKFVRMGEIKVDLIRALVAAKYHVLVSDADVVLFRDPWPFLIEGLASNSDLKRRVAAMVRADVLTTTDCIDEQEDTQRRRWLMDKEFNTGVLFFRGSNNSLAILDRWKKQLLEEKGQGLYINDQAVFNRAFHNLGPPRPLSVPNADPSEPKSSHEFWDDVNTRSVYHMTQVADVPSDSTIGVLPMVEFINGHSFFVAKLHNKYGVEPVALHATYQFGDNAEYSYGKRERLRSAGLWLVDDDEYYTKASKLLVVKGDLLQGFHAVPNQSAEYDGGIDIHMEADALQRRRLRDAFAIALTLGRTLVLPVIHCYCDRYWWLLHECRMPGAERMDLPYDCPLDHIFEPSRWYQANLDFRPRAFLDDPRQKEIASHTPRATLPKTCFCRRSDPPDCEQGQWQRLSGVGPAMEDWEKQVVRARVVDVDVELLDSFCWNIPKNVLLRIQQAFLMRVGLCSKERNIIPPDWKPEKHPLNCSWGYADTRELSQEEIQQRRQDAATYTTTQ